MAKGGARNRSGPAADPTSRTSERKGYTLTALPHAGYDGAVPDLTRYLPDATARHEAVWSDLWKTPQACAWSGEAWRWPVAADLVRWVVRGEAADAAASIATSVRQLRDDLGLSTAGLKQHGWAIASPVAPALAAPEDSPEDELAPKRERRLREPVAQVDAQ